MIKLIINELIKIFKRKNIYLLLLIGLLVIFTYNFFQRQMNTKENIGELYERILRNDTLLLENYDNLNLDESYEDIVERIALEKYAIENNIDYNILLNSQNSNTQLPVDARILLMKVFKTFDIAIIFIVVYLSSTVVSEEISSGTIKFLLTKPHSRIKILFSKIITSTFITVLITIFMVIFQFILRWIFIRI